MKTLAVSAVDVGSSCLKTRSNKRQGKARIEMETNEQTAIELLRLVVEHCKWCDGDGCSDPELNEKQVELVTKFLDTVEAVCRQVRFERD